MLLAISLCVSAWKPFKPNLLQIISYSLPVSLFTASCISLFCSSSTILSLIDGDGSSITSHSFISLPSLSSPIGAYKEMVSFLFLLF